jgi:hypothetical protein
LEQKKKLLLIIGHQLADRCTTLVKFVKYLPEFGVQPIVYIPENPTYPIVDQNLVQDVSDQAIILKQKIFEPYQLASFLSKNKTR